MSMVQDIEVCERCEGQNFSVFDCHTNLFDDFCLGCGTELHEFYKTDSDGNYVRNDEDQILVDAKYTKGVGVAYISYDQNGCYYRLDDTDASTINHWKERFKEEGIDLDRSYLTVFKDGKLEYVIGKEQTEMM